MSDLIYTNVNGQRIFLNNAGNKALTLHVERPHIRFKVTHGHVPEIAHPSGPNTYELAFVSEDSSGDIYDYISDNYTFGTGYNGPLFSKKTGNTQRNVLEIIDITFDKIHAGQNSLASLCEGCTNLTAVCDIDCTNITYIPNMFRGCSSLTAIPTFTNVTRIETCNDACNGCVNVTSGALALYNQLSAAIVDDCVHNKTFYNCGSNTVQGAAELAQIPNSWK